MNTTVNNPIILDFTQRAQIAPIETALMPAALAKKLLEMYAEKLTKSSLSSIVRAHAEEITMAASSGEKNMEDILNMSQAFIDERTLIANIKAGNWDAYKTEQEPNNQL